MTNNTFNQDFQDLLALLNSNDVDYILVGGYSVILHGYPRTTGDMDVWVNPTKENYKLLLIALNSFRIPKEFIPEEEFLDTENIDVFSIGRPPVSIDIMTSVKGLNFNDVYKNITKYQFDDGLTVNLISKKDLIKAKHASGRYKDLDDIENLS